MIASVSAIRAHLAAGQMTEDSTALEVSARFADHLRFCHDAGHWLIWSGSRWQPDRTCEVLDLIRELARETASASNQTASAACHRRNFVTGVDGFARADRAFARVSENWDAEAFLLGTPGETVDLRTGLGKLADPADGITKSTAVRPADRAECPIWLRFIRDTFKGDAALIRFVQQFFGYALTGDISEHALLLCVGPGGNGKGVLANTISGIMGDYAQTAAMDTFTLSRHDKHPADLAMLRGARLVTALETEEGRPWAEARLKALTGGDLIQARFMRQDFFRYRPAFKLVVFGNHKPVLHNVDDAARRRINIVPFEFKPPKPDPDLEDRLRPEWPAILRWLIEGCLDWRKNRLVRPDSVRDATETYFNDQDMLGQWLDDQCDVEPGNPHKWEPSAVLFGSYRDFAARSGEPTCSAKTFAEQMRRRGFETHKGAKGSRQMRGVRLNPRPQWEASGR